MARFVVAFVAGLFSWSIGGHGQEKGGPKLAPMPVGRAMFVAAAIDGRVYCVGGNDHRDNAIPTVHVYDVARNTWAETTRWPTPSVYPCGAAVNGKLYIVGAPTGGGRTSVVERYDPATSKWERLADLPTVRSHSVAVAVGHELYVIGGHGRAESEDGGLGRDLDDVSILDTRTGRWAKGPKLPAADHGMAAAVVGGKVHVLGGLKSQTRHLVLDKGEWKRRAAVPMAVVKMPAAAVGGKVVVIGGGDKQTGVAVYDPAADKWARGKDTVVPRYLAQLVTVGDRAYAFGGVPGDPPQARVEAYDVAADRWHD
jgi:N-acetylneuraminic acid mutarotase